MAFTAPKGNRYALGHGRPAKYANAEELEQRIEEYFEYCQGEYEDQTETVNKRKKNSETGKMDTIPTEVSKRVCTRAPDRPKITTLALFLGFESRSTMYEYLKRESFSYPLKRALMIIESEYEDILPFAKGGGVIFALKNMGWEDRTQVDSTVEIKQITGMQVL
ncbi:terminase small subunit [Spirosoma sp. KUDC1026]|uniref:terminase small subunit n=1 Tax=Spirosoma sp. KUDC1026 TaxID=2745947 RepID=UPI00159B87D9|nr:terminase small subunit [Spirosoma sp. KUDC1026]QKZ15196.1 hypothetical protein HU175_22245 [Spirosoma sp. KUDC1026]